MCNVITNKDVLLSRQDVKRLRKAYNNYNISVDYLCIDVKNIMLHEGLNKSQAINKILNFISNNF